MKLTFYNHYGVGDLFESREFVKDWMKLCGVTHAQYAHRTLPGFFADLPGIESVPLTAEMDMRSGWKKVSGARGQVSGSSPDTPHLTPDTLFINTWIGARNAETRPAGDYVIWPGVGCVVENLYRMHNDYLREAGLPPLPRTIAEYIPTIDYTRVQLGNLHTWLAGHDGERLVLVCNGTTGSGQAANFDMGEMVEKVSGARGQVSGRKTSYLLTAPILDTSHLAPDTVFSTDKLTQRERREPGAYGPCDFNAISYLSRFCDVIVGRCSGPQMGAQVLENWLDSTKTLVCFTQHRNGACFVREPERLGLNMKVVWSPAATAGEAAEVMKEVL